MTKKQFKKYHKLISKSKLYELKAAVIVAKGVTQQERHGEVFCSEYLKFKVGNKAIWNGIDEFTIDAIKLGNFDWYSPRLWSQEKGMWYLLCNCKTVD